MQFPARIVFFLRLFFALCLHLTRLSQRTKPQQDLRKMAHLQMRLFDIFWLILNAGLILPYKRICSNFSVAHHLRQNLLLLQCAALAKKLGMKEPEFVL